MIDLRSAKQAELNHRRTQMMTDFDRARPFRRACGNFSLWLTADAERLGLYPDGGRRPESERKAT